MNENNVNRALADVTLIKQILSNNGNDSKLVGITLKGNILIQSIAAMFTVSLCLMEFFSKGRMTQTLFSVTNTQELKIYGISFMAFILIGLLIPLNFILWRASKHNGEDYSIYIERNFSHFRNASLMSDLLMKFLTIALLVLADKPEWIAIVLTAFIGDYLLQNRFFTFPLKLSIPLGLSCILIAIFLFTFNNTQLFIPLFIFALITTASLVRLLIKARKIEEPEV